MRTGGAGGKIKSGVIILLVLAAGNPEVGLTQVPCSFTGLETITGVVCVRLGWFSQPGWLAAAAPSSSSRHKDLGTSSRRWAPIGSGSGRSPTRWFRTGSAGAWKEAESASVSNKPQPRLLSVEVRTKQT